MNILLSNDDSVHAWGLEVLYKELKKIANVWVVAPLDEKSTTGHSLTLHKPLRIRKLENGFYGASGSPADCVYLGIREVMKKMPDIVISGINRGANLGQDVYYSGTVSAAREACILGLPAIAVSTDVDHHKKIKSEKHIHFETAAKAVSKLIKNFPLKDIPQHTLLNVNVPDVTDSKIKGVHVTRQGFRHYSGSIVKRTDHRGRPYYWIGGQYKGFRNTQGTDCHSVAAGFVSVTPIKLDCTDYVFAQKIEQEFK